ncbi:MAG TPA: CsbD family protein [Brumimicrobium sp.]|nr:CsbD family protein [Brumimicrobium sp.]
MDFDKLKDKGTESLEKFNLNDLQLKGKWEQIKGKIKQSYAQFTDDDLKYVEGKEQELFGRIIEKTGKTKKEVYDWIKSLK